MIFTVTYRGADGSLREERVEAVNRPECFAQCRSRGIAPLSVKEGWSGRNKAPNRGKVNRPSSANGGARAKSPSFAGKALLAAAALALIAGGVAWWLGRGEAQPSPEPETPKKPSVLAKEVKPVAVPKSAGLEQVQAIDSSQGAMTNRTEFWNGHEIHSVSVVTNGMNIVTTRIGVDGKIYKQIDKVNGSPIFDNPVDQALAIMLTTPKGGMIPPMPPLSKNSDEIFIKALKRPIEIDENDSAEVKRIKRLVLAAREEMFDQIAAGRSVSSVIEEHCTTVNENAKLRAQAMAEYRRIIEEDGDLEMAEQYREKANQLLTNVGAAKIDKRKSSRTSRLTKSKMKGTEP